MKVYAILLAGGIGERLYPLSTSEHPKFFLRVNSSRSLIKESFIRAKAILPPSRIYTITTSGLKDKIVKELQDEGFIPSNVIEEPLRRNTLPAFVLSALSVRGEKNLLCFFPADHIIRPISAFKETVKKGIALAEKGYLTLIGVKPSSPSSHYGYILKGRREGNGHIIERFVEKPSVKKAKKIITNGGVWNSGIYIVRKDILLSLVEQYSPEIIETFHKYNNVMKVYSTIPSLQFDKAITEKTKRGAVVEGKFEWLDIGSLEVLFKFIVESGGYVSAGTSVVKKSRRVIAVAWNHRLLVENICDMLIIETEDGLRVEPLNKVKRGFYGKSRGFLSTV